MVKLDVFIGSKELKQQLIDKLECMSTITSCTDICEIRGSTLS